MVALLQLLFLQAPLRLMRVQVVLFLLNLQHLIQLVEVWLLVLQLSLYLLFLHRQFMEGRKTITEGTLDWCEMSSSYNDTDESALSDLEHRTHIQVEQSEYVPVASGSVSRGPGAFARGAPNTDCDAFTPETEFWVING